MGLAVMTKRDRIELVCSADPDVTPNDEGETGWMPRSKAGVGPGADVVTVRPLTRVEYAQLSDVSGATERWVRAARMAVVSVNGNVLASDWFEGVQDLSVLWTLGAWVWYSSDGRDPQPFQRLVFSGSSPEDAEAETSEGD